MVTQSLRGLADVRPDALAGRPYGRERPGRRSRSTRELSFKVRRRVRRSVGPSPEPLAPAEMQALTDFAPAVDLPAESRYARTRQHARRRRSGARRELLQPSPPRPAVRLRDRAIASAADLAQFGTDGLSSEDGRAAGLFKIPHLRNAYQKVGMFGMLERPDTLPGDKRRSGAADPRLRVQSRRHRSMIHRPSFFVFAESSSFRRTRRLAALQRTAVADFVLAFDSNLAPIVVPAGPTLTAGNDAVVGPPHRSHDPAVRAGPPRVRPRRQGEPRRRGARLALRASRPVPYPTDLLSHR